jgi:integral membrane protein
MLSTALGRFRLISFIEGVSTILLFFVAIPLKYQFDLPMAVRIVGSAHGLLFLIYIGMLVSTWASQAWPLRMFIVGLFAAIPPFGTFLYDHFMVKAYVNPE